MTDYLRFVEAKFELYAKALEPLGRALHKSGATRIVDLCSGSGGPFEAILQHGKEARPALAVVLRAPYPHQVESLRDQRRIG